MFSRWPRVARGCGNTDRDRDRAGRGGGLGWEPIPGAMLNAGRCHLAHRL